MQPEGISGFHQSSSAQGAGSSSAYFPRARAHCLAEGCFPESSSPSPVAFECPHLLGLCSSLLLTQCWFPLQPHRGGHPPENQYIFPEVQVLLEEF